MHPLLFELFGLKIHAYGVMVALAFIVGFTLIGYRAKQAGDRVDDYLEAIIWFIIAGIGGARLFYFLWFPDQFFQDPVGSLFSQGGLVWYGGVIGAFIATIIYTRIKKIGLHHFGDIITPAAALGLAIGRIGCLLAGCCYGAPCALPWAIQYPHTHETQGIPVHPAPLYETFLMLIVMGILLRLDKNKPFEGFTTWWFFILAGVVRFSLEFVRGDKLVWSQELHISASQWVSVAGIVLGTGMLLYLSHKRKQSLSSELLT